uniref:von Willebrand factor type A domain protein n=1 Tax=Pithovirus LCPAC406 TaxID=2506599 RepID=A0A481ZCW8_9VIRU|nr:MAG: von Willebrand factor type A domain protein [Pithovirus LCPAC406]
MDITTRSYLYENEHYVFLKIEGKNDIIKSTCNREVILIIDISGSMKSIIDPVKLSLKSFRDVIHKEIQDAIQVDMKQVEQANDDEQKNIPITLIIFNDKAEIFNKDIDDIEPKGKTNISEAINLAFNIKVDDKMTWIILFSDGHPTVGITTEDGFRNLESMKPKRTKIICAGFKKESSSNILASLGDFKFIENEEDIDPFFKSVAFEIITATSVNFTSEPISREGVLLPDVVFAGSIFSCTFKCEENNIKLKYTNLEDNGIIEQTIEHKLGEIDDEIKDTVTAQNVRNFLIEIKETHNTLSSKEFSKYQRKIMDMMLKTGDRNAMIKIQSAFDLIKNNNHGYEDMLTIEKTQSQVNKLQTDFVRKNSVLPPRYKSELVPGSLVRSFSGID